MHSLLLSMVIAAAALVVSASTLLARRRPPDQGHPHDVAPPRRNRSIEGYWYDMPGKMALSNNATAISVLKVEYGPEGYRIHGTSHRIDGEEIATWVSEVAALKESTLYYFYRAGTEAFASGHEVGAVHLTFAPDGNSYHGVLQIFSEKPQMVQLQGERISEQLLAKASRSGANSREEPSIDHATLAREILNCQDPDHAWWAA